MSFRSICFVIMPFGRKADGTGRMVDFDRIYNDVMAPAVEAAGLDGIRADEEQGAGFIHKLMYERILLSEYAIADLTILNANVYYELGIRHAARPETTVLTLAQGCSLPFDVGPLRSLPYALDDKGLPADVDAARAALTDRLVEARRHSAADSPLFQLLEGYQAAPIDRLKTDVFRTKIALEEDLKARLAKAREGGRAGLDALCQSLGDLSAIQAGVAVDLMLSYRALSAFERIVDLCPRLDMSLRRTQLVREQWALALNRVGRDRDAEDMLTQLIEERGPSSETNALLGRIHKDRWARALKAGDSLAARGHLRNAIVAYRAGFEADWRDAYPGINAVTLMTIADPKDPLAKEMAGVVRYAVRRRLTGKPDYWDHATMVELGVIASDWDAASNSLSDALAALDEPWKAETTANNLRMIADARQAAGIAVKETRELIAELEKRGPQKSAAPS
ncbi:MAG: TRAFs-binding domain-containing protein [Roseiarcus sp.]